MSHSFERKDTVSVNLFKTNKTELLQVSVCPGFKSSAVCHDTVYVVAK